MSLFFTHVMYELNVILILLSEVIKFSFKTYRHVLGSITENHETVSFVPFLKEIMALVIYKSN